MVIGLSIPRLFMKNQPRTRASTIGLGMAAKSLVIILYQLLTEHFAALRRWGSLKAYMILNALEIVFWAAVAVLTIQLIVLAIYATVISYGDWKQSKGGARPDGYKRAHELRSVSPAPSV
ncbi:hypothetical protein ABOM_001500 [Aspergillus bombycis]|uniref:Uncharacterized protein n=1 Tax=Aspergillus bombycis TaxID=109264 RepID=A0A1F8AE25_9EURO|nr:hypothetical protein ABOM_001500 [Aspergillus bombycis]OGM49911.1 hypothetical protein ABOM_001500 [Aspergillus bombycis]